jgi:hypothetical protein
MVREIFFALKLFLMSQRQQKFIEKYRRWHDDIVVYPKLLEEYGITDAKEFFINAGMSNQLYDDVVPFFIKLREYPDIAKLSYSPLVTRSFRNSKPTYYMSVILLSERFISLVNVIK